MKHKLTGKAFFYDGVKYLCTNYRKSKGKISGILADRYVNPFTGNKRDFIYYSDESGKDPEICVSITEVFLEGTTEYRLLDSIEEI